VLLGSTLLKFGVDYSKREWEGKYFNNGTFKGYSINQAETENRAIFVDTTTEIGANLLRVGLRYDDSEITNGGGFQNRDFTSLNGYIFDTYTFDNGLSIFGGVGISHRVPDGRELYFQKKGNLIGTPTLNQTKNLEFDLGLKKSFGNSYLKLKLFYSKLDDYIYFHTKESNQNLFENIDAKIYGVELTGAILFGEKLSVEYGVTYQRGKKDKPLEGQSDLDLADIAPLRGSIIATYNFDDKTELSLEVIGQSRWSKYDGDNGEQEIAGFVVANVKLKRELSRNLEVTLGVDNIFDKTYTPSNTYNDLTLIMTGAKKKVKLNDTGRYIYTNISYKF